MKRFGWKIFWCLLPVVLAALVVGRAYYQYQREGGGFKLGVDLVGGTIHQLISLIKTEHPDVNVSDIERFMDANYRVGRERRTLTEEAVNHIKDLISQVGSLEFRILADSRDDEAGIKKAEELFDWKN